MAYAQVGDLNMYYDVHGQGRPLVLLHGAYQTADTMGPPVPGLAESRRVVVPEMQAHGRTADIDRPITAPTMIVVGDSDAVTLEHVVKLFRLRGGGVMGDLSGLPDARLAVLPATTHYIPPGSGILDRSDWLLAMIPPFIDA